MNVTVEYLESIINIDKDISALIIDVRNVTDEELIYNANVYREIIAIIPLSISKMKAKYNKEHLNYLSETNMLRFREQITRMYRMKGFNVFFTNHNSETEICMTITNEIEVKDFEALKNSF